MGRRLRRVRHLAQQVVTVTRRLWKVCLCCGTVVRGDPRQDVVPLSALISDTKAARGRTQPFDNSTTRVCCPCTTRSYSVRERCGYKKETIEKGVLHGTGDTAVDGFTVRACPRNFETDKANAVDSKGTSINALQVDTMHSMALYQRQSEIPHQGVGHTTDPNIRSLAITHQTEEGHRGSRLQVQQMKSPSSQTDDMVGMRFYGRVSPSCSTDTVSVSSIQSIRPQDPMRFYSGATMFVNPEHLDPKMLRPTPRRPKTNHPDHQTRKVGPTYVPFAEFQKPHQKTAGHCPHDHREVPPPWMTRGNPVPDASDSTTTIETMRRHWGVHQTYPSADDPNSCQVKTLLTLKFPMSKFPCPPVTKPEDLVVEFAVDEVWEQIFPVEWTIQQNIVRTLLGRVDLVMLGDYNRQIVLKTCKVKDSEDEAQILIDGQSNFVVELCASLVQGQNRYLCMTYYTRRDLAQWLKKDKGRKYFGELEAKLIYGYIIAAVQYLHHKRVYHMDIKPSNTLVNNRGYPVLGDFGSAIRYCDLVDFEETFSYSPAYASPQIQAGERPGRMDDLWSAGCIFYEIIARKPPFLGSSTIETERKMATGPSLDVALFSPEAKEFVIALLQRDRRQRLGFAAGTKEVMCHPFLKYVDFHEIKYGCHVEECPVLFDVFRQMERDEMDARNKPDPIPLESPFHQSKKSPWPKSLLKESIRKSLEDSSELWIGNRQSIPEDDDGIERQGRAVTGIGDNEEEPSTSYGPGIATVVDNRAEVFSNEGRMMAAIREVEEGYSSSEELLC